MRFCPRCKEWVRNQWFHCPWCGKEQSQGEDALEAIAGDLTTKRNHPSILKKDMGCLNEISGKLDALETELNQFLAEHHH